jgi:Mg2+-importing ATPase
MRFGELSVKTPEQLLRELGTSQKGLGEDEANNRLSYGANLLPTKETRWWEILLRQFRSSFVYLLFVASAIALFLKEFIDAALIFLFLLINALLGFIQEHKAEHTLSILKTFTKRKTRVRRNGREHLVDFEEVVPGDVVLLRPGDMIPADGYFLSADGVSVDESILTGESQPTLKSAGPLKEKAKNIYEAKNIGFAQTTLISGKAELLVFATGAQTEIGRIAESVEETRSISAFEIGISRFSVFVLRFVFLVVPLVFIANALIKKNNFNFAEFLIFSIAMMVSIVPEALPLVITLSLTKGALKLAKKDVLPRRLSAIEDFGSIDILCTDKTGTITENKLEVAQIYGNPDEVIFYGLCGSGDFSGDASHQNNTFDRALLKKASEAILKKLSEVKRIETIPFDPLQRKESVFLEINGKKELVMRGAPEVILEGVLVKDRVGAESWYQEEGRRGRRVIAVSKKRLEAGEFDLARAQKGGELVGMISFNDPLKPSAKRALRKAEKLGVHVKILTGDSKEVAGWVAYEIGLIKNPNEVLTGDEFEGMSPEEKERAVRQYDVFARTTPLQKYKIIETLKKHHFVGFLGEGFNDAPALKLSHVGLAVKEASHISQDASDVILLNRSLEVIIDGIQEGRKTFANTIKYIKATLTSNYGNFFALAFASLMVDYLPMLPVQILLLNLLTDLPMVNIITDAVDPQELKQPRGYNVKELAIVALVLGIVSTIFDFTMFGIFVRAGEKALQTMWFIGSVLTELMLLFSIRSSVPFYKAQPPAPSVSLISGAVAGITILLPFTTFGSNLFGFIKPTPKFMATIALIVISYFAATEIVKLLVYRFLSPENNRKA